MIAYTLLIEEASCAESEPCSYAHVCNDQHAKQMAWRLAGNKLQTTTSWCRTHVTRKVKDEIHDRKNRERLGNQAYQRHGWGWTGNFKIIAIELDDQPNTITDAEYAAFKLGGWESVDKLRKGLVAEEKAKERARVRAEKAAAKVAAREARQAAKRKAA